MLEMQFYLDNTVVQYQWADYNFWHSSLGTDWFWSHTPILGEHGKDV